MIYTFYSFKGGVGRSMAVANLAESFHGKGLRTLVIDWDLEAPGLETYFALPTAQREAQLRASRSRPGLIDLLQEYQNAFPRIAARLVPVALGDGIDPETVRSSLQQASAAAERALQEADDYPSFLRKNPFDDMQPATLAEQLQALYLAIPSTSSEILPEPLASSPLRAYVQTIHAPDKHRSNGLYLMSAGAREGERFASYATSVQEFDWANFYASVEGHQYFSWLRQTLNTAVDVVLIDSRTGVTEMGGVCTRHLADAVVAFCAPNSQNLDGVLRIMRGVNRQEVKDARGDDRHVDVVIVPARVDLSESDRLTEFSASFASAAEHTDFVPAEFQDLERPFLNLQVPYIPRYNYGEERVIGQDVVPPGEVGKRLLEAYSRIVVHLAALASPGSLIRDAYAGEIGILLPHLAYSVPQMAPAIPDTLVRRDEDSRALVNMLLHTTTSSGRRRIGVWGPPGSGKTSLVAAVCRDPKVVAAFPDGILWLTPDRQWTGETAQAWLRSNFRIGRSVGARALQNLLDNRRFLLVADDVWDIESISQVLDYGLNGVAQILISRDLHVASVFGENLLSLGPLKPVERSALFPGSQPGLARPDDPTYDLARAMIEWPLGASLVRAALERRLALRETPDAAWENLRQAFLRHRVLAFDTPGTDRSTSAGRTLAWTLSRLGPDQRKLLADVAQRPDGIDVRIAGRPAGPAEVFRAEVERLCELGLAHLDDKSERAFVDPLVQAYLLAQGELRESLAPRRASRHVSSSEDQKDGRNQDVERGKAIVRGQDASLGEITELAERLKSSRYFALARRLFAMAREHREAAKLPHAKRLRLVQRHALCTYRDADLPTDRFDRALEILHEGDLNEPGVTQETLGLAGAIHKYRWRLSGVVADLEQALTFYSRGYFQGVERDFGYTAINAAFVFDVLEAQRHPRSSDEPRMRPQPGDTSQTQNNAQRIREAIVGTLPAMILQKQFDFLRTEWWFHATVAEAFFGLGRHEDARYWLREGLSLDPPDWEIESTTRQLAALAYTQDPDVSEDSESWRTLRVLVGDAAPALYSMMHGKIGLALSGGGFRASLFHIGVFARLAELDVLRHVEVLSCVSGGSIIGAYYYLEVRKLLAETHDATITREQYLGIVERMEREFLAGVQQNLRTRLFLNWWANLRTLLDPSYTRTNLLGVLFERHLYSRVADGERSPRFLSDMQIRPADNKDGQFNPKLDNWRRAAKAPILLLNATTLNTGHNWQFAVSWMGEPPLGASSPIDGNDIMRRMYYWEAPRAYQRVRLGQAVAASACVPGLFDPIEMNGLFPRHKVRLVDGGVHDNQGVAGLIEQECTVMLVSDASGQTNTQSSPSGEITGVPFRANDILMARVREAEYRELHLLRRSGALNGLMFIHLKKDLAAKTVDWVGSPDPYVAPRHDHSALPLTSYGTQRVAQDALAGVRTDLDSFSDTEAYALMASGYRMTDREFSDAVPHWPVSSTERRPWTFNRIAPALTNQNAAAEDTVELVRRLRIGANRGLKIWRLAPPSLAIVVSPVVLLATVLVYISRPRISLLTDALSLLGSFVMWFAITVTALFAIHKLLIRRKGFSVIATGLAMITVGWIAAAIHMLFLDPLFLLDGSLNHAGARRRAVRQWSLGVALVIIALLAGLGAWRFVHASS